MASLRDLFVRLGIKTDPGGVKSATDGLQRIANAAKLAVTAVAGFKMVQMARGVADDVRQMGDRLDKVSQQVGVTTDALQELEFAGGLAGASQQDVSTALRMLSRNAFEASTGAKEYQENFDALGISVRDGSGQLKSADALLMEVSDGMSRLSTDTERTALAQTVLGRSGAKLVPLLKQGSAAIAAQRQEAQQLGVMNKQDIATAVELTDNQLRLSKAYDTIKFAIGRALLPAMNSATKRVTEFLKANGKVIRQGLTKFFERVVRVIGSVVDLFGRLIDGVYEWADSLTGVSRVLLKIGAIAAGIAVLLMLPGGSILLLIGLIALLIDDFETWRKGGESVIGDLVEWMKSLGDGIIWVGTVAGIALALMLKGTLLAAAGWLKMAAAKALALAELLIFVALWAVLIGVVIWLGRELYRLIKGEENFFTTMKEGIDGLIEDFGGIGPAIWEMVKTAIKHWASMFGVSEKKATEWIANLEKTLMGLWDNVLEFWSKKLGGWWDEWGNFIDFGFGGDSDEEIDRRAKALFEASKARAAARRNAPAAGPATVGGPSVLAGPAVARAGAAVVNDRSTRNINMNVQTREGQSNEQIANTIIDRIKKDDEANLRATNAGFAVAVP